tara:strand:+ start:276 stop:608 length:333 start_codon:yes stop_codon:yes gene_type:complete
MRTEPIASVTLSTSWQEILPPRLTRVAVLFSVDTAQDILIWPVEQPASTQGILLDGGSGGNSTYWNMANNGDLVQRRWYARSSAGTPSIYVLETTVPQWCFDKLNPKENY